MPATYSFTDADFESAVKSNGGEFTKKILKSPKLYKATSDLLKAVAKEDAIAGVSAIASGSSAISKAVNASRDTKVALQSASTTLSVFKASFSMAKDTVKMMDKASKVNKVVSPTAMFAYASAVVIQKVGITLSLAGSEKEKEACLGAVLELAGNGAATAFVGVTGGAMVILTIASLTASAANAYMQCRDVDFSK